jgi:DNA repair protein RadD
VINPVALRPYQSAGVESIRVKIRGGARRVLVVAPTGAGKTVIFSHVVAGALSRGKRCLVVAHRRELINQAYAKLLANGLPESEVGVIMGGDARRRPAAPIQVGSIDTLRNRAKPPADLVIIDEAHRALSKSYTDLVEAYPDAVHAGFTATPFRADNRGLGDLYEALVVVATPRVLIGEGYLVEPRVWTVPASKLPDLSGVRVKGGDYDERELAAAVDRSSLVGDIVDHWRKHAAGVRTVAFAVSVEHSKHIAEQFRAAGVAAEHLDGETPTAERDAILGRLERGETLVVSNCGVLCEGWDQPSVKCCILARPTKSTGLYLQQAGRILRPWQNARAVVLDHAGCAAAHGLPQDEREYSLEGGRKRAGAKNEAPVKTCEGCYAVVPAGTAECPECGKEFAAEPRQLEHKPGELVEVDAGAWEAQQLRRRIQKFALRSDRQRGWKDGETNGRLMRKFKKSRTRMTLEELRAVVAWLEGGAFDTQYPVSVPAVTAPVVVEVDLAAPGTGPSDEEVVEWVL